MIFPEFQKHQHHSEEYDERKGKHMRIHTLAHARTVSMETSERVARPTLFCGPIEEDEKEKGRMKEMQNTEREQQRQK